MTPTVGTGETSRFTVIWIIEAPSSEYGGMLQCVPHTDWNKDDPRVTTT